MTIILFLNDRYLAFLSGHYGKTTGRFSRKYSKFPVPIGLDFWSKNMHETLFKVSLEFLVPNFSKPLLFK